MRISRYRCVTVRATLHTWDRAVKITFFVTTLNAYDSTSYAIWTAYAASSLIVVPASVYN